MSIRATRVVGALGVAAAALAPVAFSVGSAAAADTVTQQVKVTQSNWFWESPLTLPVELPVPVPVPENPVPAGILIPAGDLATSLTNAATKDVDRVTYLQFATGDANDTATVKSFKFTLKVDSGNLTNYPPGVIPSLEACYPSRTWAAGEGSTSYTQKPLEDCDGAAEGKYDAATKSYTFEVKSFAQDWVEGVNFGVAVRPSAKQLTPFILAFQGPKTVTAAISYVQGAADAVGGIVAPVNDLPVVLPDVTPVVPVVEAAAPVAIPVTPTAPVVSAPQSTGVFTAAAGTRVIGETSYDGSFWWSIVAGLAGVVLVGWFMGRRPAPVTTTVSTSRLSQVLAARARAGH